MEFRMHLCMFTYSTSETCERNPFVQTIIMARFYHKRESSFLYALYNFW